MLHITFGHLPSVRVITRGSTMAAVGSCSSTLSTLVIGFERFQLFLYFNLNTFFFNTLNFRQMIQQLAIYKETYKLVNLLYRIMPEMERMHRHVIGVRIMDVSLELFKWITMANQSREKELRLKYLDAFICEFEQIKNLLRICNDNSILKLSSVTSAQLIINGISKQAVGWRNATSRM